MWSKSTASTGTGKVKEATEMRKRMQAISSAAFVLMLVLAACGSANKTEEVTSSTKPKEVTSPVKQEESSVQAVKEQAPVEKSSQAVMAEKVQSVYMPFYGVFGTATLEEMIAHATIIVRATFDSVRPVGVRSIDTYDTESQQFDGYHGSLEFTFNVLEYLKGTGGNQIKGIAHGWPTHLSKPYTVIAATEAEAATLARGLLTHRDTRWDDHEAIVIFRNPPVWSESNLAAQLD